MRFIASATLILALAGCAATPGDGGGDINSARNSWQGAAYEDVVRSWGAPARATKLPDGRDAYTWVSDSVASRPSFFPSLGIFGGSGGIGFGTGVTLGGYGGGELQRCERTLFFQSGRVAESSFQGPGDYCASFRRG